MYNDNQPRLLLPVEIFRIGIVDSFPQSKDIYLARHLKTENRWRLVRNFTVFECLRLPKSLEIELVKENKCWTNATF